MSEPKRTGLDDLLYIIEEAKKHKGWHDPDDLLDFGKDFRLSIPFHIVTDLFNGLREMVKENILMYSHEVIEDKIGNVIFSDQIEHNYGNSVGKAYYCMMEKEKEEEDCDKILMINKTDIHLFYTYPIDLNKFGYHEKLLMYYSHHPFEIDNRSEDSTSAEIIIGKMEFPPLEYVSAAYFKEKGDKIKLYTESVAQ